MTARIKLARRFLARHAYRLVYVYVAFALAVVVHKNVEKRADNDQNKYLFTSFCCREHYAEIDAPFQPRLISNFLATYYFKQKISQRLHAGEPIEPDVFQEAIAAWCAGWFFLTLLLFALFFRNSLFFIFGTFGCTSLAYTTQNMFYPYDVPALFFFSLLLLCLVRKWIWLLPLVLAVGTGIKETMLVCTPICLFLARPLKWRVLFFGACVGLCLAVRVAIDVYAQRPVFWMESAGSIDVEQQVTQAKWLTNLGYLVSAFGDNALIFVNGGITWLALALPARMNTLARGFKLVMVLFIAGLFLFAGILEYRIWFELIPFGLYNVWLFLRSAEEGVPSEAAG
ncbi:MAG: hypothetical protein AAF492_02465 [Verrucomicrobiota bacterium]